MSRSFVISSAAVAAAAAVGLAAFAVHQSETLRTLLHIPLRAKHTGMTLTKEQAADVLRGVPTIDIAPLIKDPRMESPAALHALQQVADACERWGFMQIVNHGVPDEEIKRFEAVMRAFFALPADQKKAVKRTKGNARGYYDDELTKQARDWKQGFDYGAPHAGKHVDGENRWPEGQPEFRRVCESYFGTMEKLAALLMRAIALALGVDGGSFEVPFRSHTSFMRLNYYPRCPQPEKHFSVGRHTDAGSLTILKQDDDGPTSLEVRLRHTDRWVPIPPRKGAYVINIGDLTQVWSNGRFAAAEHRVKANKDRERFSAPFFYNPAYDVDVAPLGLSAADKPVYRPINWGDFRRKRYAGDYANYGEEVQISHYSTTPEASRGG